MGDLNEAVESRRAELARRVHGVLDEGVLASGDAFEPLALAEFAFQYEQNAAYRRFCEQKKVDPGSVRRWNEIPAYPTDAFKTELATSFPVERAVLQQLTSGTSARDGSAELRGKIFRDALGRELVFRANRLVTGAWLFPDFELGRRCRLLILTPSPAMAPSMGMAIGMEQTRVHFGTEDSRFLIGRTGLDVGGLLRALEESEESGTPVAIVGATSAFVFFFNACRAKSFRFRLPAGSRLCDGGGYRGRFGEVTRDDYYRLAEEILGVPESHCVNVLGMAETATNYADDVLASAVAGRPAGARHKVPPPWTRVEAVSIRDLSPLPPGEIGLLRHYDLVNLPTVLAVQSDNLGVVDAQGGFEIVGRARVVDGKVVPLPSERTVGPMGDRRIFRFLEAYVNFSIDFKMGRYGKRKAR
jgi:hypothetical protein